jgi:hypothetical protein
VVVVHGGWVTRFCLRMECMCLLDQAQSEGEKYAAKFPCRR